MADSWFLTSLKRNNRSLNRNSWFSKCDSLLKISTGPSDTFFYFAHGLVSNLYSMGATANWFITHFKTNLQLLINAKRIVSGDLIWNFIGFLEIVNFFLKFPRYSWWLPLKALYNWRRKIMSCKEFNSKLCSCYLTVDEWWAAQPFSSYHTFIESINKESISSI